MTLRLAHLNLPARDPEGLARWYEQEFGFERHGTFLSGRGTLIVFETGEPIGRRGNAHFGFAAESAEDVHRWAARFGTAVESEPGFTSTKVRDPEENLFEIYWEFVD